MDWEAYMIRYKIGTEVAPEHIFEAFNAGFVDYIIKIELTQEDFFKRFFGPEGNEMALTMVAFDDETPIGLCLGGIRDFDGGAKTMRCGGLCVAPDYRGKGVSLELMKAHVAIAREKHCQQVMLEVIGGNDRAIQFYEKIGYHKIYRLEYYTLNREDFNFKDPCVTHLEEQLSDEQVTIKDIKLEELNSLKSELAHYHISWQCSMDYAAQVEGVRCHALFRGDQIESFIITSGVVQKTGRIFTLWTRPASRFKGYASCLVHQVLEEMSYDKIAINFSNSASLTGFVNALGFSKQEIYQYEMYLDQIPN